MVVYLQHIRPFFDTVSCCRLFWGEVDVTAEEHIEAIKHDDRVGDFTLEEAMRLSDRIWNLNRAHYLERNGGPGRSFDYPNARFYEEAVPSGPSQGRAADAGGPRRHARRVLRRRAAGARTATRRARSSLDLGLAECVAEPRAAGACSASCSAPLPPVRGERYKPKAF